MSGGGTLEGVHQCSKKCYKKLVVFDTGFVLAYASGQFEGGLIIFNLRGDKSLQIRPIEEVPAIELKAAKPQQSLPCGTTDEILEMLQRRQTDAQHTHP